MPRIPAVTRDFGGPDGAYAPGVLLIFVSNHEDTPSALSGKEYRFGVPMPCNLSQIRNIFWRLGNVADQDICSIYTDFAGYSLIR